MDAECPLDTEPALPEYGVVKSVVNDDYFVTPRPLNERILRHCVVLPSRLHLIKRLPSKCRIAEIGTFQGQFARAMIEACDPQELHLFDVTFEHLAHDYFDPLVAQGRVKLHQGNSSAELSAFPDHYFDWIYIDGDHSYDVVSRDIMVAKSKIRRDGYLVFNDYTTFSPLELMQYGVQRAVNDLCLTEDFEIIYFAFGDHGYHDVCLRRALSPARVGTVVGVFQSMRRLLSKGGRRLP